MLIYKTRGASSWAHGEWTALSVLWLMRQSSWQSLFSKGRLGLGHVLPFPPFSASFNLEQTVRKGD